MGNHAAIDEGRRADETVRRQETEYDGTLDHDDNGSLHFAKRHEARLLVVSSSRRLVVLLRRREVRVKE